MKERVVEFDVGTEVGEGDEIAKNLTQVLVFCNRIESGVFIALCGVVKK